MSENKETRRKWAEKNRERCLVYYRRYREKHPEAHAKWREKNRDKVLAAARRSYAKNKLFIKLAHTYGISVPEARELVAKLNKDIP